MRSPQPTESVDSTAGEIGRPKSPRPPPYVTYARVKPTGDAGREPACRSRKKCRIFQYGQSCRSNSEDSDRLRPSQGMTLDKIEVSLDKAFEAGMAYVALSRARSLDGLRIAGDVNRDGLRSDPKVVRFYKSMTQARCV